jgi:hypothetical protein
LPKQWRRNRDNVTNLNAAGRGDEGAAILMKQNPWGMQLDNN